MMCLKVSSPKKITNVIGQLLFLDIKRKVFWFLTFFCLRFVKKFSIGFEILRKEYFRGHYVTSLWGREKRKKIAYCWEHDSKQLLLNNVFRNVCRFRDIRGQRFVVLAPKILYYVIYDQNFDMIRLR